ncbi:MAG: hypothetical protein ACR2QU_12910 [Gammaproteobacteria bacterium]
MRASLPLMLGASALLFLTGALAGPREYLFQDKRICDTEKVLCFRGSLTYYSNPRLIQLNARVRSAPGPGMLRISLTGTNHLGHKRFAPFEVRVRGTYSEIINHKMIPDYPDVTGWEVIRVQFIADKAD